MDGIDAILQAEQEAERIRREAKEAADALLADAEGYRQRILEETRRECEKEQQRMLEQAEKRASERRAELGVVAQVKEAELRSEAGGKLEAAAAWIAERIAEL
jgi:vacuolar-type H+-ATPase subunit H